MYEIWYNESTHNTTSQHYIIYGLSHDTSFDIHVRAYTIAGPGEWNNGIGITLKGITILVLIIIMTIKIFILGQSLLVLPLNDSAVWLMWTPPDIPSNNMSYIVEYTLDGYHITAISFQSNFSNAVVAELNGSTNYHFKISYMTKEGRIVNSSQWILPGNVHSQLQFVFCFSSFPFYDYHDICFK